MFAHKTDYPRSLRTTERQGDPKKLLSVREQKLHPSAQFIKEPNIWNIIFNFTAPGPWEDRENSSRELTDNVRTKCRISLMALRFVSLS